MLRIALGLTLVAVSIFLGCLSAAMGDPKGFSRGSVLDLEPEWRIGLAAIGALVLGVLLAVFPRSNRPSAS